MTEYKTTPEQRRKSLEYYYKNKIDRLLYSKKYKEDNKEHILEYNKKYRIENKKAVNKWTKKYLDEFKKRKGISYQTLYTKLRKRISIDYKIKINNKKNNQRFKKNVETIDTAIRHKEYWIQPHIDFIKKNRDKMTHLEIANKLGRTLYGIKKMVTKINKGIR